MANGSNRPNYLAAFVFSKALTVGLVAIGLLSIARTAGVVDTSGFARFLLARYDALIALLFDSLFGWLSVAWFDLTGVERHVMTLVMMAMAGVSVWVQPLAVGRQLLVSGSVFCLAALIFGVFIDASGRIAILVTAVAVMVLPAVAFFQTRAGMVWLVGAGLRLFERRYSYVDRTDEQYLWAAVNALIDAGHLSVALDGFNLSRRMILEYYLSFILAVLLIGMLLAAGVVELVQ